MEDNNINQKLRLSYLRDLQKPELDKFERATIIKQIMVEEDLSQRKFAEKYNFSHSTVHDWLSFGKITKEEYKEFQDVGITDREILRIVRKNVDDPSNKIYAKYGLDSRLLKLNRFVRSFVTGFENYKESCVSVDSTENVKQLINSLNRLLMRLEKR